MPSADLITLTCRDDYDEWMRLRLLIETPRQAWLRQQSLHEGFPDLFEPPQGEMPRAGLLPWAQQVPDNYQLHSAYLAAVNKCNRESNASDSPVDVTINIDATTAPGPFQIPLNSFSGFPDRAIQGAKRIFWSQASAGIPQTRLTLADLANLDIYNDQYMNEGPGVPTRVAIDSYVMFLLPGPSAPGQLTVWVEAGMRAPSSGSLTFGPLPAAYDEALLYMALVELSKMMPSDPEMSARAASFGPDAAAGQQSIADWFDRDMLSEFQGGLAYQATGIRRYRRM